MTGSPHFPTFSGLRRSTTPGGEGGVQEDLSDSLKGYVIKEAAHHLDLFFSNEEDTEEVKECRRMEVEEVRKWVEEKRGE